MFRRLWLKQRKSLINLLPLFAKERDERLHLSLYIQANSSRNQIIGIYRDKLKIKIQSPPVDGAANAAMLKFLAKELELSQREIKIESGFKNKQKIISVPNEKSIKEKVQNWDSKNRT